MRASLPEAPVFPDAAGPAPGAGCLHGSHDEDEAMHIRDWPEDERPREKLIARGVGKNRRFG
jgi:hypothetical protein